MPCEQMMRCDKMIVFTMRKRPHHSVLVRARRQTRQMLADVQTRYPRLNRLEFAANLRRRVRLHVEHVEMTRGAGEEDDDHRFRRSGGESGIRAGIAESATTYRPMPRSPE